MGSESWSTRHSPTKSIGGHNSGAGDAFIAAMAVALLDGKSAYAAACWGVAASAIAVRKKGAQESYPSMMELRQMIGSVELCNGRELV
ncbi:hypothetical protein MesoLjLa_48660 [Mesorhizobium sp. L-2-11]|nr:MULTISPECIES: PfkB family carbohydrate kinase [unclassified Mesorhizobium]BCH18015.1 hypothetical protein MesoLjLa_48660 [Mesorhizobium sp. L-2-11]